MKKLFVILATLLTVCTANAQQIYATAEFKHGTVTLYVDRDRCPSGTGVAVHKSPYGQISQGCWEQGYTFHTVKYWDDWRRSVNYLTDRFVIHPSYAKFDAERKKGKK